MARFSNHSRRQLTHYRLNWTDAHAILEDWHKAPMELLRDKSVPVLRLWHHLSSHPGGLTTIHNFDYTDAAVRLRADASHNGAFYGTSCGGTTAMHSFSLSMGLAPFAQPRPSMAWWAPL